MKNKPKKTINTAHYSFFVYTTARKNDRLFALLSVKE